MEGPVIKTDTTTTTTTATNHVPQGPPSPGGSEVSLSEGAERGELTKVKTFL